MRRGMALSALLVMVSAPVAAVTSSAIEDMIAAERGFAHSAKDGLWAAFRGNAAPEAVFFMPQPVRVHDALAGQAEPPFTLEWWPTWALGSSSGDMGFTMGPSVSSVGGKQLYGSFFTVWRRQADGKWRWVLDHGVTSRDDMGERTMAQAIVLPPSPDPVASAAAFSEVTAAEAALAVAARTDARGALKERLAAEAYIFRPGPQPARDAVARAALLEKGPEVLHFSLSGGDASAAGDLAYTFGEVRRSADGPVVEYFVRGWRRVAGTWKIVMDRVSSARSQ